MYFTGVMREEAEHNILWSVLTLFFLLNGQLFYAIEQSRIRLNGGSYSWSGFGYAKWTNVREFQDYSSLALLVFRSESFADHLHGHLRVDCDLLYWLPWNSNNGSLGRFIALTGSSNTRRGSRKIRFRRHKRPCAYYANSNATFHLMLDVGDLVFKLNPGPHKRITTIVSSNRMVKNGHLWSRHSHSLPKGANLHNLRSLDRISVAPKFSFNRAFTSCLMNARSLCNKTLIVKDFVVDYKEDLLGITVSEMRPTSPLGSDTSRFITFQVRFSSLQLYSRSNHMHCSQISHFSH